jgi:hypothetical protein
MKDLIPPPARTLPTARRQQVRSLLTAEDLPDRTSSRRVRDPLLAAAAAGLLAVGGVYAFTLGNDSVGHGPAQGGPAAEPPTPEPEQEREPKVKREPPPAAPSLLGDPQPAYDRCMALLSRSHYGGGADPGMEGRLAVSDGAVTTVVVSDGSEAYTCNIAPDRAVSNPSPDLAVADPGPETFAFALNEASNVDQSLDGQQLSWAGGRLPEGVTSVTYVFADGHEADAVVEGGYWVMQDLAPRWVTNSNGVSITVELDGPGGSKRVSLPLMQSMCNQVTHGC